MPTVMLAGAPAVRLKPAEVTCAAPSVKVRVNVPAVPVRVRPTKVATPEEFVVAVAEVSEPVPEATVAVTVAPLMVLPLASFTVTTGWVVRATPFTAPLGWVLMVTVLAAPK